MQATEKTRFDSFYQKHLTALKLHVTKRLCSVIH